MCRSGAFSESGVVNLLRDAINRLAHGHLHEARVECKHFFFEKNLKFKLFFDMKQKGYRLLLPVYETRGNYLAQGICHRNLQQLCWFLFHFLKKTIIIKFYFLKKVNLLEVLKLLANENVFLLIIIELHFSEKKYFYLLSNSKKSDSNAKCF